MQLFPYAHATHPQWNMAANLVVAQLRAQMALPTFASTPSLGLLYLTDHYAPQAQEILDFLSAQLSFVSDWSGTVGIGIASNNVEYFDEPAMAIMLCALPPDQYRVFSGVTPLPATGNQHFQAHTALVHADASTPDMTELIEEIAQRTQSGYLFGGLTASRNQSVQFAISGNGNLQGQGAAGGVFTGGLSGVAFSASTQLISRLTQGCQPISKQHSVTAFERNLITALDGKPALDVMLNDLGITMDEPHQALEKVRATLVGLNNTQNNVDDVHLPQRAGQFGTDVVVRHLIGLDPKRQGIAIADFPGLGTTVTFCQRNVQAARADLIRICTEIREELEPQEAAIDLARSGPLVHVETTTPSRMDQRIAGAIYISCSGRGGPHFGGPSAEMHIVRRALGDVPLVGFFAGGEIARNHLYGYTGVLTVFAAVNPPPDGAKP